MDYRDVPPPTADIVVAGGGAGKFTSVFDPLAGHISVSKKIEEPV